MESKLLPEVVSILETLLSRAEQPNRQQVIRVRLNKGTHPWYFSGQVLGLRASANEQLQYLAAQGLLTLRWQKHEEGNLLLAVDLAGKREEAIETLYRLLGRIPTYRMRAELLNLLEIQQTDGEWFKRFIVHATTQLQEARSPAPLSLSNLKESQDLLRALAAIATLKEPVLERTLSIQLFGKSKRLHELRSGILSVLRAHALGAEIFGDDDWALLHAHHIHRVPEYIPLAGPLCLEFVDARWRNASPILLQLDARLYTIGLPGVYLSTAIVLDCQATALVTVENMTSFSELLLIRPDKVMAVFTGGFASPNLIQFLGHIRAKRPDLPFFHWGDLDAGGLRILAHLRQALGEVQTVGMNRTTFDRYNAYTQPLTAEDETSLQTLLKHPYLIDCVPLIKYLCWKGSKLEQEAIDGQYILTCLQELLV